MPDLARSIFVVTTWDERPYGDPSAEPRLAHVTIAKTFRGDLEGTSTLEYLMLYRQDGCASFVGMERFTGRLAGRTGGFFLQHIGTFEYGTAEVNASIIPASGTGDLTGIAGGGSFTTGPAEEYPFELAYSFD